MDGSGDIENQALTSKSDYKHNYQAEGNNTVCVKAQNKVIISYTAFKLHTNH